MTAQAVRDHRLDDKPDGWMLTHRGRHLGDRGEFLARCVACGIETSHVAAHGECLRLAFEVATAHNDTYHSTELAEPFQGALF